MNKKIVAFGGIAAVLVAALIATLAALDLLAIRDLRETLGRTLMVIGIITIATLAISMIVKGPLRRNADAEKS